MQWHPEYDTGIASVDAEHREVVRKLGELGVALQSGERVEAIKELILTLEEYVLRHFAHEEALMLRTRCSAEAANCRAHQEFTRKFATWVTQLRAGHATVSVAAEIQREASAWIRLHILTVDCALRNHRTPAGSG
jgi:hemerythrin